MPRQTGAAAYYAAYYDRYALRSTPAKLAFYRRLAEGYAPQRPGRIADLGCAFGTFLASMPATWERHGFDTNADVVAQAASAHPGIHFTAVRDLAEALSGTFDVITAFDVLEHIPDLSRTIDSLRAHLCEAGVLVYVVPVYDGPLGPAVRALDRDPTHVHKWSRARWLALTSGGGLEIVACIGVFRILLPVVKRYVHATSQTLRAVSPAIAVVARR